MHTVTQKRWMCREYLRAALKNAGCVQRICSIRLASLVPAKQHVRLQKKIAQKEVAKPLPCSVTALGAAEANPRPLHTPPTVTPVRIYVHLYERAYNLSIYIYIYIYIYMYMCKYRLPTGSQKRCMSREYFRAA